MNVSCLCFSYIIQKQKDPNKAHQIKLEVIVKALKWLDIDMDVDEVIVFPEIFFILRHLLDSECSLSLHFAGGVYHGHSNLQESCKRLLCSQEQSGGFKQARSFPQIDWQAC